MASHSMLPSDGNARNANAAAAGEVESPGYPHSRHLCTVFPFTSTNHLTHCSLCYCYACGGSAPCTLWFYHCEATDEDEKWRTLSSSMEQNSGAPSSHSPQLSDSILPTSDFVSSAFSRLTVSDQILSSSSSNKNSNELVDAQRSLKERSSRGRTYLRCQMKNKLLDIRAESLATQIMNHSRKLKRSDVPPVAAMSMKRERNASVRYRRLLPLNLELWRDLVAGSSLETGAGGKYKELLRRFSLMEVSFRDTRVTDLALETDTDKGYHRLMKKFEVMDLSSQHSTSSDTVGKDDEK